MSLNTHSCQLHNYGHRMSMPRSHSFLATVFSAPERNPELISLKNFRKDSKPHTYRLEKLCRQLANQSNKLLPSSIEGLYTCPILRNCSRSPDVRVSSQPVSISRRHKSVEIIACSFHGCTHNAWINCMRAAS